MSQATQGFIRFAVACVLGLSYPLMTWLAFNADATLTAVMIAGYVAMVALFLYGSDPVIEMIEAYRG